MEMTAPVPPYLSAVSPTGNPSPDSDPGGLAPVPGLLPTGSRLRDTSAFPGTWCAHRERGGNHCPHVIGPWRGPVMPPTETCSNGPGACACRQHDSHKCRAGQTAAPHKRELSPAPLLAHTHMTYCYGSRWVEGDGEPRIEDVSN